MSTRGATDAPGPEPRRAGAPAATAGAEASEAGALEAAGQRVVRQLVESLVFEGLLSPRHDDPAGHTGPTGPTGPTGTVEPRGSGEGTDSSDPPAPGEEAPGEEAPGEEAPGEEAWVLDLPGDGTVGPATYRWRARRRLAFGRTALVGPIGRSAGTGARPPHDDRSAGNGSRVGDGSGTGATGPVTPGRLPATSEQAPPSAGVGVRRVVAELAPALGASPERVRGLADELERTVRNDAEALAVWRDLPVPGPDATADELESWTVAGHLYHPSYKSRVGFDPEDNRRYGPEFSPVVRPLWLALPRREVTVTAVAGLDPAAHIASDLGPATVARFRRRLAEAATGLGPGIRPPDAGPGAGSGDHVWVPVHPWQWRERLAARLAPEVAAGRVVVLGEADDAHRPKQSIRTLGNATHSARDALKLALGIVNTSTARTLAPHTLRNGPLITDWLRGIVADDPVLGDELRVAVLGERVTASYAGPGPELPGGPDGDLGCLWREGVAAVLEPGEGAVPFTTPAQRRPDGACWVGPWLAEYGAERWVARLLDVAITPVAQMLWGHGIALEAHAQNLLVTHRGGWPERLVVRDLHDGIRFCRRLLAEPDRVPPLAATPEAHLRVNRNSFVEAGDAESVRDFVADAFFFVNLAELAFVLADEGALDERRFWELARGVLDRHRARFPSLAGRAATFDLLAPTIGIEQLTTRRLLPDDRLRIVAAPNPLAAVRPRP